MQVCKNIDFSRGGVGCPVSLDAITPAGHVKGCGRAGVPLQRTVTAHESSRARLACSRMRFVGPVPGPTRKIWIMVAVGKRTEFGVHVCSSDCGEWNVIFINLSGYRCIFISNQKFVAYVRWKCATNATNPANFTAIPNWTSRMFAITVILLYIYP